MSEVSSRPIPISSCGSQATSTDDNDDHDMLLSPGLIARSCPEGHNNAQQYFHARMQLQTRAPPPHAPRFGSLPEPSFLQLDRMPDLMLPPPAAPMNEEEEDRAQQHSYRAPNVLQFATSCPTTGGGFYTSTFARRTQQPWAPSPRTPEELDLSKSPALAAMSAMQVAHRRNLMYGNEGGYDDQLAFADLSLREDEDEDQEFEDDEDATYAELTGNGYAEENDARADLYGRVPMHEHNGAARRGSYDGVFPFDDQ